LFELFGKLAVVTGAGSGIGAATARLFARQGARVAALDLDGEAATRTAAGIGAAGGAADAWTCDVSNASQVRAAFDGIGARHGRIHILVNNAGIAHVGDVLHTSEEDLDRLYRVNVKGMYLCAQAAVRNMVASGGGAIVNLASIATLVGVPERFAYSVSKGAVLAMTKSIAVDYMKHGIRCNCVCPARVHTPFVDGFVAKNYPGREQEVLQSLAAYQPIGRMGTPEEVAALALYLAADESSFVTGAAYPIDGGVLVT
jgi:NAD(P)-dependent dehydrogenase (short-subunit alcohol dehydrogenase family)